jgi:uncharacterized protein (TIRG00374 family)
LTAKKLFLLIFLSVLVFIGLAGYGDFREVGHRIVTFPAPYLLAAVGLAAFNYLLRFLRWSFYLKVLKIEVPFRTSSLVFLSGLALSLTPGKVGELLKSYLLRSRTGTPVSVSAPVVAMERLTDVVAVVLVGLTGMALLPTSIQWILGGILVLCGALTLLFASRHSQRLFDLPVIRRWKSQFQVSQEGMRLLTRPGPMLIAVALGTLAWLSEGIAFWVILQGMGTEVRFFWSLPIYTAATIVGAISTLPGGLVGTEGTMLALLQQAGVDRGAASAVTLLVRLVTLWFAVGIGLVALGWLVRSGRPGPVRPGVVKESLDSMS